MRGQPLRPAAAQGGESLAHLAGRDVHARRQRRRGVAQGAGMAEGIQQGWRTGQGGQEQDLRGGQLLQGPVEVGHGRGAHPHGVQAEGKEVQVEAQDLLFVQHGFQAQCRQRLAQFAPPAALVWRQQTGQLHGDRGGARDHPAAAQVVPRGAGQRQGVQAAVAEEPPVLQAHEDPPYLGRELAVPQAQQEGALRAGQGG